MKISWLNDNIILGVNSVDCQRIHDTQDLIAMDSELLTLTWCRDITNESKANKNVSMPSLSLIGLRQANSEHTRISIRNTNIHLSQRK
jgi:hypothetical protein